MNVTYVNSVRKLHRPYETCSCGKWSCVQCETTWPCDVERAVRDSGYAPVGIYDYGLGKHLLPEPVAATRDY